MFFCSEITKQVPCNYLILSHNAAATLAGGTNNSWFMGLWQDACTWDILPVHRHRWCLLIFPPSVQHSQHSFAKLMHLLICLTQTNMPLNCTLTRHSQSDGLALFHHPKPHQPPAWLCSCGIIPDPCQSLGNSQRAPCSTGNRRK